MKQNLKDYLKNITFYVCSASLKNQKFDNQNIKVFFNSKYY
jgi:intracellular sulfur oxidation DsrE/DsrF family protein